MALPLKETMIISVTVINLNMSWLFQVSYTFCRDFILLLLKDAGATSFGQTEVLLKALQRVSLLTYAISILVLIFKS